MTFTYLNKSLKLHFSSTLFSILLLIILTACGTNSVTISSPAEPLTPLLPTTLDLNAAKITEDSGSLSIQSDLGFQCPYSESSILIDQLVLASDRTTYSQDEIAQMGTYVGNNFTAGNFLSQGTKPPPTLRWALGGSIDPVPGTNQDRSFYPCGADLILTNTGSTPIQIPKVSVQLEGRPQENLYSYHLIDACTVIPKSQIALHGCTTAFGGYSGCSLYIASIQLGLGEKNSVFSAVPSSPGCDTLTIAPAAQVRLDFGFSLASNIPGNLVYSIAPILTVYTAQGKQTLPLTQMRGTLAFANINQFSCYGLQGTTFVLEQSPKFSQNLWCI
jgi:hypothetical protein